MQVSFRIPRREIKKVNKVEGDRGAGARENKGWEGYGRWEGKGWEAGFPKW